MVDPLPELSLLDAWSAWAAGLPVADRMLWGTSILWWGRIGKLLQLLGALTIVAEIIGAERLRSFGESLHGALTLSAFRDQFTAAVSLVKDSFVYLLSDSGSEKEKEALRGVQGSRFAWLDGVMAVVLTAVVGYLVATRWSWLAALMFAIPAGLVSYVTVSPFLAAVVAVGAGAVGLLVDVVLVEPFAWLIERPELDKLLKTASVFLLLVGFHFDLLAS